MQHLLAGASCYLDGPGTWILPVGITGTEALFPVGGDALQSADRDRLGLAAAAFLDATAPARRFAGTIAGAPEDSREHVRRPVDHVRVGIAPGRDQADVFGHRGVGRAGPLAIDDFVEVVGDRDVRRFQYGS